VGRSRRTSFDPPHLGNAFFCRTGEVCLTGDVNGDTVDDIIAFNHGLDGSNAVFIAQSTAAAFLAAKRAHDFFCLKAETCAVGDVTGDKKADLIAFTRETIPRVFVGINQ
jgi:hypothetical protein